MTLGVEDLDRDPFTQFAGWFRAAGEAGVTAPEAAAVATATPDGRPSVRMVLVKTVDERGFVFFTNYESRKGSELQANPRAALLFHWEAQERQIRLEGSTRRVTREETVAYAHTRARASQLSALASRQSRPLADRAELERRVTELDGAHPEGELPVAPEWGGVRLDPDRFEFWQGGAARLHDRFVYTPADAGGWAITRLAP
jgi:pyridoxamine 5'-phosphate oxidase